MAFPKPEQVVNDEYLDFIRSHTCLVSGRFPVDADHLLARGTGSASRNDYFAIPLHREFHSERHQIGTSKFEAKYRINLWKECAILIVKFHQRGN